MDNKFKFKPAEDMGLSVSDRASSLLRERSIFSLFYGWIWWFGMSLLMRVMFRFRAVGEEHLPKTLPFIMVGNHSSHLDVVSLMLALPKRVRMRFFPLAAKDYFFTSTRGALFTAYAINALPMPRKGGGVDAMQYLRRRILEVPCGYVLFPEGTRSRTGEISPFKPGIGILVAGTNVPVVPCYLDGAFRAFPADKTLPRPTRVTLHIGKPLVFDDLDDSKESSKVVAQRLENAVLALQQKVCG